MFENNDMVWNNTRPSTHSYIVESLGPVIMQKTCFKDNLVGSSDVVVFGSTFENSMNFVSNSSGSLFTIYTLSSTYVSKNCVIAPVNQHLFTLIIRGVPDYFFHA